MTQYDEVREKLIKEPKTWLVTGVAGFIGSNLLETLLKLDQVVIGMDNFSTGYRRNLDEVEKIVESEQWSKFVFIEGDIRNPNDCEKAVLGVDFVLHQAALGSVPRSINDPAMTNEVNITGFLNMLVAAKNEKITSFVYAASSSTYGDHAALPKVEDKIGNPLSPYAVTKYVNELYADVFARAYGFNSIGLRYFNVFGRRQDPDGAYAAVIPKWTAAVINAEEVVINGDGETSRDFCYIENVIQANLRSAVAKANCKNQVYNVAVGERTSLNKLYADIVNALSERGIQYSLKPVHADFREGDVRHSLASIAKAQKLLDYCPSHTMTEGLDETMDWYIDSIC